MAWGDTIVTVLKKYNVRYLNYVPDSKIEKLLEAARNLGGFEALPLTREEEGIGVVCGQSIGGARGVLLCPTAGLGNSINALASLAITYRIPCPIIIVWDNRSYAMTGGQPTATAYHTDLAAVARGAGYLKVERVETIAEFKRAADRALVEPGPWFIHCLMQEKPVTGGGLPSPTAIKHRFMDAIGAHH